MGSIVGPDKLGALTESGGTISLAASTITLGGQQYRTSTLNVAAVNATNNNLRYIYVVLSSGSPALIISDNVNSVGPTGYTSWKLVGAFYSDGLGNPFGSFVNIEGAPNSSFIRTPTATANISFGSGGSLSCSWARMGSKMILNIVAIAGSGAGLVGDATFYIPTGVPNIDLSKVPTGFGSYGTLGAATIHSASEWITVGTVVNGGADSVRLVSRSAGSLGNIVSQNLPATTWWNTTGDSMTLEFSAPADGWKDTPLKDL